MKAVVFKGIGSISVEDVPDPHIESPTDAVVRVTSSAICGTDLHMIRGTLTGMRPGTVLGHEGVGIIEQLGDSVRNLNVGDRVVIMSSIACGYCSYCRAGYFSQCDNANPHGRRAGTAFFGGPADSGPFNGLQAEKVRVPFANVGLVKLPDSITDEQGVFLSDIFPAGYFGADNAEIKAGDIVVVFGCGPVGQFAIASASLLNAGRVIAVDQIPSRLEMAKAQGAETVDFSREDPVKAILGLTGGIGADRVIDAVGVDAQLPHSGPAAGTERVEEQWFRQELSQIAPRTNVQGESWRPGDAPTQALQWEVEAVDKAGTLSIIGVYPQSVRWFPIGMAMNKNLTIKMGNCNHRKYVPLLIELIEEGIIDPTKVLTNVEPLRDAVQAYESFDHRQAGWIKVELTSP
ncbi:MAG: zinc-dependent alcohol dehydrogenase [Deltaproteobacteria bacterium]